MRNPGGRQDAPDDGDPADQDVVDKIMSEHRRLDPDVDVAPLAVVTRVARASRILDQNMRAATLAHGVEPWEFDVLATLRRTEPPYQLSAGALVDAMMLSPGAITNRVDRLVTRGLVTRDVDPGNRRRVLIALTPAGHELVTRLLQVVVELHGSLLAGLSDTERDQVATALRKLLLSLGDRPAVRAGPTGRRNAGGG